MLRFYIIFVYLRRPVKKFLPFLLLTLLLLLPAPLVLGEGDATAAPTPEVTPAPTEAPTPSPTPDPLLNSRCTLDWQGFCNYPNRLTDNSYKSGADLRKGMKGGIYWTEDVPAGIVCWEWIVPPDACQYTFVDADGQPLSTSVRYREGDRGYLPVPDGARGVILDGVARLRSWEGP